MGIINQLTTFEKKLPIGLFFGIFGVLFGLYQTFFHEFKPDLMLEVVSDTSVLSVYENVSDLSINFKGEDLNKSGKELRIVLLKLSNKGNKTILPTEFQPGKPWGFKVEDGEIIDFEVTDSNSRKLVASLNPKKVDSEIIFSPTIFEKEKYFSMKLLVLTNKNKIVNIITTESIADVESVDVQRRTEKEKETLLKRAFFGDPVIQVFRIFSYSFFMLLSLIILGLTSIPIFSAFEKFTKWKRKNKISAFLDKKKPSKKLFEFLEKLYLNGGLNNLKSQQRILNDDVKLNKLLNRKMGREHLHKDTRVPDEFINAKLGVDVYGMESGAPLAISEHDEYKMFDLREENYFQLRQLMHVNIITKNNDKWIVDEKYVMLLNDFISYLET